MSHLLIFLVLGLALAALLLALSFVLRGALLRAPSRQLSLVIRRRIDHDCGWLTLHLQRSLWQSWRPLPAFRAGQSIAISLPKSKLRRRYSIARWQPRAFSYEITIKPEPMGKLTQQLLQVAKQGVRLSVQHPSGDFVLPSTSAARRTVFIAGGVGITPLLAMLDQATVQQKKHRNEQKNTHLNQAQECHLFWQIRHDNEAIYKHALEQLTQRHPAVQLHLFVSQSASATPRRLNIATLEKQLGSLSDTQFFLCASAAMLDDFSAALTLAGVASEHIHFERFHLASATESGANWNIQLDGKDLPYQGHRHLLDALEDAKVELPSDCRTGSCGQCRVRLLSGQTRQLTQAEFSTPAGQILACCSVPTSDLTLLSVTG